MTHYQLLRVSPYHWHSQVEIRREVEAAESNELSAGFYSLQWNASGFSSGIYFYHLQTCQTYYSKQVSTP
jgi:hypothetical protein